MFQVVLYEHTVPGKTSPSISMKNIYLIFFLLLFTNLSSFATHLRGGEIRTTHISGQTYKISVVLYLDNTTGQGASSTESSIEVCTGDGPVMQLSRTSITPISNATNTSLAIYEGTHTYSSSGRYQISARITNRTANILNYTHSEETPMFLWTVVNTAFANSTPFLPLLSFEAGVKQPFVLDLSATDTEGDSITYTVQKLSKTNPGTCAVRTTDNEYLYPNDVNAAGTFAVDAVKRKLIWTAPTQVGQYIYALVVHEWRNGIRISETYREGVVVVTDKPGNTVEIPPYQFAETQGTITSVPKPSSPEISISVDAFPIPTENYITVKAYSQDAALISLQVIDIQGRVVMEYKGKTLDRNLEYEFDLRKLSSGLYLIKASNNVESVTKKIMRQ